MERPLCPICKTNHFARETHAWKGGQAEEVILEKTVVAAVENVVPVKPKFDRKAYQREYMRKWRAKK